MELTARKPAQSFKDLLVWQSAYELTLDVYRECQNFPDHEKFGLISQMTRSAVSVCSNIAEGFGRRTSSEKDNFYSIAKGSLTELENQILIAQGVGYINSNILDNLMIKCVVTQKMLFKLQKSNKEKGA